MSAEWGNRQVAKDAKDTDKEARKTGRSTRRAEGPTLSDQEAAEAGRRVRFSARLLY